MFLLKVQILMLLIMFLQLGPDPALYQGCFGDPEDLPHGGAQTDVPHGPTGHHHHPGLHQGHDDPPQIQTGAPPRHLLVSPFPVRFMRSNLKSHPPFSSAGGGTGRRVAPSESPRVVGEAGVHEDTRGGGVHAVLRAPQGCQETADEAKD